MGFGEYPKEYNPAVHGPYDPARFYGKTDTPFGQLKLNEIGSWIGRRNKTPQSVAALFSRGFWRWNHKYVFAKNGTAAPYYQFIVSGMILFYVLNWNKIKHEKVAKYH